MSINAESISSYRTMLPERGPGEMLLAHCQMSAPLEHKGHFLLNLENQFANSIRIRVKFYHENFASDRILHVSWAYLTQRPFLLRIACDNFFKKRICWGTLASCGRQEIYFSENCWGTSLSSFSV